MSFQKINGPLELTPDSPTVIQTKLNSMFAELYALVPALNGAEELKFTVSSSNGRIDTSQVTRLKLSRNLARLGLYMNEFGLSFVPSVAFEITEVLTSASLARLNNFFQIYYNSPRLGGTGGVVTPTPAPVFTRNPSFTPTTGKAGETTFSADTGLATNTLAYYIRWLLDGVAIGYDYTVMPTQGGTLVLEVTATGPNYSTKYTTSTAATVAPASTPSTTPALGTLTLSKTTTPEGVSPGTVIATISGKTAGSTLSLFNDANGRFSISGTNLLAGLNAIDYEVSQTLPLTIRETLSGSANSPKDSNFTITVTNVYEAANLSALSFSGASSLMIGSPTNGTIVGNTAGSTLAYSGLPSGFTIDATNRTWSWSGSGSTGNSTVTLTETLADSANSPKTSVIGLTIYAAGSAPTPTPTPTPTPSTPTPTPSTPTPSPSTSYAWDDNATWNDSGTWSDAA